MDNQPNNTPRDDETQEPAQPDQVNEHSEAAANEAALQEPADQPLDFSDPVPKIDLSEPFSWQAVEGVQHEHETNWYVAFGIVTVLLMLLAIFVLKDITFTILIPIMAIATFMLTRKPPRMVSYSISPKGIYIADKLYDFSEFKAFGVITDTEQPSIVLIPTKRFGFGATIYFDEADGERIVDLLGARIPMKEIKPDPIDKFIRWTKL